MENKKEYPQGIYWNERHEKAPEFVLGKIAIDIKKHIDWLNSKLESGLDKYVYIQLKSGTKDGKPYNYLEVDNWKPKEKVEEPKKEILEGGDGLNTDDIPF